MLERCKLINVSDDGALLSIDDVYDLPNQLSVALDQRIARRAELQSYLAAGQESGRAVPAKQQDLIAPRLPTVFFSIHIKNACFRFRLTGRG